MARVDSLPVGVKEVLQAGSAIEREFSYELISRVTDLSERELLSHLSVLKDSELIYERGVFPQSHYVFKHALTREVVYGSILERGKKTLHHKIADAIEEIYKDNLAEKYGILADHFIKGENYKKGSDYARLAGKRYLRSSSFLNAAEYNRKAIVCLERLPRTKDIDIELIDVRCALADCYAYLNFHVDLKEAIDPAIKLAEDYNYKRGLSLIHAHLGSCFYMIESDLVSALEYLDKAIKLSSETKDYGILWMSLHWYGLCLTFDCQFERAINYLERIVDISGIHPGSVAMSTSLYCAFVYCYSGEVNLGYQKCKEAVRLADDMDDIYLKSFVYMAYGHCCFGKGFLEESIKYLLEGLRFHEKMNSLAFAARTAEFLGESFFQQGVYEKSLFYFSKSHEYYETVQSNPYFGLLSVLGIARAKALMNEGDINVDILIRKSNEYIIPIYHGMVQRGIGEILLNIGEHRRSDAEEWINKAIETDTRNGTRFFLGLDYDSYAELFKRKGDQSQAKENLKKAIEIFKECEADGWVAKYEKELAAIS
jgi:tetratricopeptide (TPR) repeat protein